MSDTLLARNGPRAAWLLAILVWGCTQPAPSHAPRAPANAPPSASAAPASASRPAARKADPRPRVSFTTPGAAVITAIRNRYAATWFHTLTLAQEATITVSGLAASETWYVAWMAPGRVHVDIGGASKGDGAINTPDSVYDFADGLQTRGDTGVNALLLLAFDVYTEPMDTTVTVLTRHGFRFDKMHDASLDGHAVYVIGSATPLDLSSPQIWVDKERFLVLRLIQPTAQGLTDTYFSQYVQTGGGWCATDITQLLDGQPHLHETASQLKSNVPLDSALFDPFQWRTAKSWHGG